MVEAKHASAHNIVNTNIKYGVVIIIVVSTVFRGIKEQRKCPK